MPREEVHMTQDPDMIIDVSVAGSRIDGSRTEEGALFYIALNINRGAIGGHEFSREDHRLSGGRDAFSFWKFKPTQSPEEEVDYDKYFPYPVPLEAVDVEKTSKRNEDGEIVGVYNGGVLCIDDRNFNLSRNVRYIGEIEGTQTYGDISETWGVVPICPPFYESSSVPGAMEELLERSGVSPPNVRKVDEAIEYVVAQV